MVCGRKCSMMCLFVSVWGFLMLNILGVLFYIRSLDMLRDIHFDHKFEWETVEQFREEADKGFQKNAIRCFITATVYLFFIILSIYAIRRDNKRRKRLYKRLQKEKEKEYNG
ncbi:ribonuclease kappa-B [Drosophila bipectinata]|uniref:ribonuclease kappa-B n=1 Tax=Drosophila bipectinata TaxID=42026 RepID=UPI0007E68B7C|nr:ribonuclease kappa-B [Drosophila bipectinata]